jgi:hypothetical protein
VLLLLAYVSMREAAPTVREQRAIDAAARVVHRVVGELVAAGGGDVVAEIAPEALEMGCRITPIREGATLTQAVVFRTAEADAPGLLDRVAERLPASYGAAVRHGDGGATHTLRADAGEFVGIRGGVAPPGVVTFTVSTGCRPVPGRFDAVDTGQPSRPIADEPIRLLTALGAARIESGQPSSAPCPGGGTVYTARAAGRGFPKPLDEALRALPGPRPLVVTDLPGVFAFRVGATSAVVEAGEGTIRAAVTSGCQ